MQHLRAKFDEAVFKQKGIGLQTRSKLIQRNVYRKRNQVSMEDKQVPSWRTEETEPKSNIEKIIVLFLSEKKLFHFEATAFTYKIRASH